MPKKPSLQQRNTSLFEDFISQKAKDSSGKPIPEEIKYIIADDARTEANNKKKLISDLYTNIQEVYNDSKNYYDNFVLNGVKGHPLFLGTLKRKALRNDTTLYIIEHSKRKKVEPAEFIYKTYNFANKLSAEHDVAITKFAPTYKFLKNNVEITINIPDIDEEALEEMTVEEILEYFEDEGIEIVISDPNKVKGKDNKAKFDEGKARHQKTMQRVIVKYRKQWKGR